MIVLRSLLFNIVFYVVLIAMMIVGLPMILFEKGPITLARWWGHVNLALLRWICGTRYEFRGLEHLGAGGEMMAGKHQSIWETFALLTVVRDPVFILKRELLWIPMFGWYVWRGRMIPVNRGAKRGAVQQITPVIRKAMDEGRTLMIFPEGTRRPAGAEPRYKQGVAFLYEAIGVRCVPMALNAGLFWPRRSFLRRPGTIVCEFLPPIEAGLTREAFFALLQERIETASDRLLAEGRADLEARGIAPEPSPAASE